MFALARLLEYNSTPFKTKHYKLPKSGRIYQEKPVQNQLSSGRTFFYYENRLTTVTLKKEQQLNAIDRKFKFRKKYLRMLISTFPLTSSS